jgi:hypothetical protein
VSDERGINWGCLGVMVLLACFWGGIIVFLQLTA